MKLRNALHQKGTRWSALIGLALCLCAFSAADHEEARPNIIYILADDLGYGDLSALNPDSKIQTPNIDRLVREGLSFTDAHSPSAVCTPTRYGILTGRYCWRSRLKSGVLVGVDSVLIEPGRRTVGALLQQSGYHTACIGKWHLGLNWVKKDADQPLYAGDNKWQVARTNIDYTQPVTKGPEDFGFDYSFIIPSSLDIMPYCYLENNQIVEPADAFTEGKSQAVDGRGIFWRPGEVSPGFRHDEVMFTFIDKAVRYIETRAATGQPFFLYFPLSAPHTPWLPTDRFKGASDAGDYGDFVRLVDWSVGQLLSTLDSLDLTDNTLVMLTSDNGADWTDADKAQYDHLANAGFRGRKADIWEAGHHIPFIARWPGVIAPNTRSDALTSLTDLTATLAALLGRDLDEETAEDSYNLLPVLRGHSLDHPIRETIVHHSLDGMFAIRKGHWKLILGRGSGGFTAPRRYTPQAGEPAGQLYNLAYDPSETTNRYDERPDLVAELTELLEKYQREGRSRPF